MINNGYNDRQMFSINNKYNHAISLFRYEDMAKFEPKLYSRVPTNDAIFIANLPFIVTMAMKDMSRTE